MNQKIIIIGGVAGGATAAARARRLSESAEITLLERGPYVSFANCGLPYFISGDIEKRSKLLLQTAEGFFSRYGVQVRLNTEAIAIDRSAKRVRVRGPEGEAWLEYDKLILAQGGQPILPPLPGADSAMAFKLWTVPDMDRIHGFIKDTQPKTAVVAGGGFIGLEMAEAFHQRGIKTTVVELAPQVMITMDPEFGHRAASVLRANGIEVKTGVGLKAVLPDSHRVELADGTFLDADLVLFSVGVRPELTLAKAAGLAIGAAGGVVVDNMMRTSDPDIYAAGDMVEIANKVSGRTVRIPLAGPANRQGRIAVTNALGGDMRYRGALGTSVVKLLDHTAAATGLNEKAAREAGFAVGSATIHKDDHASYYPGSQPLTLKLVYDRNSRKLLGAQAFGKQGVEKRIDALAMALAGGLSLDDLAEVDLAYAPPYSSANDPINMASFVGQNDCSGFSPLISAGELKAMLPLPDDALILDVRNVGEFSQGHVADSLNIPVDELRFRLAEVPRNKRIFVHCKVGFRGHLAVRILMENGWQQVWNVSGGYSSIQAEGGFPEEL